jgi:SSS family solute:Na+ symporter
MGIVLSFGYWSTDFVQMQRALAVRRPQDVRFVPLSLAAAKIIFAFLIVLPGVVAPLVLHAGGAGNWNATLPSMMLHYYSPSWAALGVMGLIACLVSTFANNVAGFSSAWIQGIYRPWIRPRATEAHYVWMSRATSASAVVLSIGAAYVALRYQSLMDYMQMIFSTFNAPLFAVVALAALAPRKVAGGGLGGFTLGLIGTILHQVLVRTGILHYGSQMSANFYAAILGFSVAAATTLLLGRMHRQRQLVTGGDVVHVPIRFPLPTVMLALGIAAACVAINLLFW